MSNVKAPMHRLCRSSRMAVPDVVHRPRERKNHGCCSTRNPLGEHPRDGPAPSGPTAGVVLIIQQRR